MVNSVLSNLISKNLVYYNLNLKVFKIRKKPYIRINTRELNRVSSRKVFIVIRRVCGQILGLGLE